MGSLELLEYQEQSQQEEEKEEGTGTIESARESKSTKRNKGYDLADVRFFTEKNAEVDYKILLALYEHRALTAAQIKKRWFPDLHENSIRNRVKTLAERRILTVTVKAGIKTSPIKMYSLSTFGLRILTENVLNVMEYDPKSSELKEHYTVDNLKVRGQHNHHYDLQEWVTDILFKRPKMFHCEWRRFPFVEENDENIRVKPDWVFLETDEETRQSTEEDITANPLLYPYLYRKQLFKGITMKPILCIECDQGTMNRIDLVEKWERYRALPDEYKPKAISLFYTPKKVVDVRHRYIRETMSHAFELEAVHNDLQLFEGDHQLTQEVVSLYFERDKDLLKGEEMTNISQLITLVKAYNQTLDTGESALIDVPKTVQHLKLPVTPDAIIARKHIGTSLQLIFFAIPGWVNPIIKIKSFKRWMKEGHLSQFSDIQYILIYPNDSYLRDVRLTDDDIRYVSYQEIKENGMWGKAHYEERKSKRIYWREVLL
jgi:hypothetical protein